MSLNYQADSYILCNESICHNQLKHQELLVATLKQLAEENRRLLKERERFEEERTEKKFEISIIKQNFINLLTVAQHELNQVKNIKNEIFKEERSDETLTKKIEINQQNFKSINLLQELKLDFLVQLIKNNHNIVSNINCYNNVFDCRPYNGPKTPPTPSSKYRYTSSFAGKFQPLNNCRVKATSAWSIKDMLYYLKKYKRIFQIYSQSIEKLNENNNFLTVCNNIYKTNICEKSKYFNNDKNASTDMEFYQDLIEKHKKSLEMIENVGNRIHPSIDLSEITTFHLKSLSKEYVASNSIPELFNVTDLKNHIFNEYTSQVILKNPFILTDSKYSNYFQSLISNSKENLFMKSTTDFESSSQSNEIKKSILSAGNTEKTLKLDNCQSINSQADVSNQMIKCFEEKTPISFNIFEEGEIVDSGDEIAKKDNEKTIDKNEKSLEKSKMEISSRMRKPIHMPKIRHKTNLNYTKFTRSRRNPSFIKVSKNENNEHIPTYEINNSKIRYNSNYSSQKELLNHKYSKKYSQDSRRYAAVHY